MQETVEKQRCVLAREGGVESATRCQSIPAAKATGLEGSAGVGVRGGETAHIVAPDAYARGGAVGCGIAGKPKPKSKSKAADRSVRSTRALPGQPMASVST